jgi:TM2 domain-containing membrane protein YozV
MMEGKLMENDASLIENNHVMELTSINNESVFCRSCGKSIKRDAEICPYCGVRQTAIQKKNPGLAAIASFFFSGLGQIYNGEIGKGFLLIGVQIINVFLMVIFIGFITFPLVWVYGVYDAYKTAERLNSM